MAKQHPYTHLTALIKIIESRPWEPFENRAVWPAEAVPLLDELALMELPPKSVRRVACPRCGAKIGEWCDPASLGRRRFHKARIDAMGSLR